MSVPQGSDAGLFRRDDPLEPAASRSLGAVVAWCLTVAAVLSTVAVASHLAGFAGVKITSRILQFSFAALYPSALVVAAAVALSLTDGGTREGLQPRRATKWAEGALAVCGVAVLAASAYSIAALLAGGGVGAEELNGASWASRIASAGMTAASAVLAGLALHVIGRARRATTAVTVADDGGVAALGGAIELPRRRLLDPVVACVLVGATVLVFEAATAAFPRSSLSGGDGLSGFSGPGASVGSRLASVSSEFTSLPIAFAALAVVVLVAVGTRRQSRDRSSEATASVAAMIGLLAVLAAGYGVWEAATANVTGAALEWWARASVIGTALASGTLGAAAGYAKGQRTGAAPAEPVSLRTRFDPRVVGLCLALAALGSAVFIAIVVVEDEFGAAIGELLLQSGPFILLSVGLGLAAAVVVASSCRESSDPTRRDTVRNAVDAIAAIISLGTLVTTVFVIVYVVGYKDSNHVPTADGPFSVLYQSSAAAKVGYVAPALVCGLLATGVLRLVWDSHRALDDDEPDEPDDQIPVVDLLP